MKGIVSELDEDGTIWLKNDYFKYISIKNLFDIKNCHTEIQGDITTHELNFDDGGSVKLVVDNKRKFFKLYPFEVMFYLDVDENQEKYALITQKT